MMQYNNHYIYAIRHNVTGRMYIGCSATNSRIKSHLYSLKNGKHKNEEMQKDCNEFGYKFTAYLLEVIPNGLNKSGTPHEREAFWIHYYGTDIPDRGYNSPKWYTRIDITTFPKVKNTEEMQVVVDR